MINYVDFIVQYSALAPEDRVGYLRNLSNESLIFLLKEVSKNARLPSIMQCLNEEKNRRFRENNLDKLVGDD